jgi:hypothetical protein
MNEQTDGGGLVPKLASKVYDDVVSGSARAVGESLENAVRTALRPVDGLVWTVNQGFDWVAHAISKKLGKHDSLEAELAHPPIELTMRVLLGLQTSGALPNKTLRGMFANILATSMTSDEAIHPAYAEVLRQMVTDECKLISILAWSHEQPYSLLVQPFDKAGTEHQGVHYPLCDQGVFKTQRQLISAADNLKRLGVLVEARHEIEDPTSSPSKEVAGTVRPYFEKLQVKDPAVKWKVTVDVLRQTQWGNHFIWACGARDFYDQHRGFVTPEWCE